MLEETNCASESWLVSNSAMFMDIIIISVEDFQFKNRFPINHRHKSNKDTRNKDIRYTDINPDINIDNRIIIKCIYHIHMKNMFWKQILFLSKKNFAFNFLVLFN